MSAPEAVQAAWDDAVAHWDDPAKHTALLGLVAHHSCFAWAAARYKERAGDPIADLQLERLQTSAVATMFATSKTRKAEVTPFRSTMLMLIAMLVAMILALVIVKTLRDHGGAH